MKKKEIPALAIFMWILATLFFFYEYFLRVLPATIAKDIISSMHISIEEFALIGSGYYITYALMQLPVGFLLDRFNFKLTMFLAAFSCSLGALGFALSHEFVSAMASRLLIGVGSAFGFISLIVVTLNWIPSRYFAFVIGCAQFLGALGPMFAGAPIAIAMKALNGRWRIIFLAVALVGFILSALIAIFMQGKPKKKKAIIYIDIRAKLSIRIKKLFAKPQIWWTIVYAATNYVGLPLLGAFWGTSYLESKGFSTTIAATIVSMIWVGMAVGCPLFGKISDRLKLRKPMASLSALIGIIASCMTLYLPFSSPFVYGILFFCIGLGGAGQNISFALIAERSPKTLKATGFALNNSAIMGLAAILPPCVTMIIKYFSIEGQLTEAAFQRGLTVIPICFLIAFFIAVFMLKETYCRQQNTVHRVVDKQA